MDRNTIIGLLIIFAILIGYSLWMTPSKEEREAQSRMQDSIMQVRIEKRIADSIRIARELIEKKEDSIVQSQLSNDTSTVNQPESDTQNIFSKTGTEEQFFTLENELIKLTISNIGGKILTAQIKEFQTFDSLPLILFDEEKTKFGLNFFMDNQLVNTDKLVFKAYGGYGKRPAGLTSQINGRDSVSLIMRLEGFGSDSISNLNKYIEYKYTLYKDEYMSGFKLSVVGLEDMFRESSYYLDLVWDAELLRQEKSVDRFNGPTVYYKYYNDDVDYLSESKDDEESLITKVKWISYKQRFFAVTLIADKYFSNAEIKGFILEDKEDTRYLKSMQSTIGIPLAESPDRAITMQFYFGPNKFKTFRSYDLDLEKQIPIGWSFFLMAWINRYIVIPVFNFLEGFGWNYGIIILVLTVLLKVVLFPIAYRSYKSSAKMRVLKPDIEELGKKFPKKEDAMKKQQATMSLYKQAGVNPMAGCIPMLLQFPFLIAMFRFFPSSFELRQQPFLWADDLSSYDSIWNLPFDIPFYGDHVSLFTLLMTISTIIYTKVNNDLMGSSSQQLPGMKTMMYLMPIMFLGLFNNYASGLSYYYMLANLITFGQMYLIRRTIDESSIRKQIEVNKKKTKKKSAWQKRLEDAAKQRGKKIPRR
ncbi:MAG: membrane protein insertase YidC [Bacteroidales bacterium]|nr:membrane protein insertase YidC [Bacteroidales bacterium]